MFVRDLGCLVLVDINQLGGDSFSINLYQNTADGLDLPVAGLGMAGIGISQLLRVLGERARLHAALAVRGWNFHINRSLSVGDDLVAGRGDGFAHRCGCFRIKRGRRRVRHRNPSSWHTSLSSRPGRRTTGNVRRGICSVSPFEPADHSCRPLLGRRLFRGVAGHGLVVERDE